MILILETHVTCIILITWYSWTDHVIFTCDLVFLWSCDYVSRQLLVQDNYVYYIHVTTCTHDLLVYDLSSWLFSYCYFFQFLILPTISFLLFQCPTYTVTTFSYSLLTVIFPSCTLTVPVLMDLYCFSASRSKSRYRKLIVDHILVQLFFDEFSFFSWLFLFGYGGWHCLSFSISYMCFYWLYMHICVLPCLLLTV